MSPKEKAEELLNKMLSKNPNRQDGISMIDTIQAKLCALVAVDECIDLLMTMNKYMLFPDQVKYYQEVKSEIEKI
jgi:hypothetical protein